MAQEDKKAVEAAKVEAERVEAERVEAERLAAEWAAEEAAQAEKAKGKVKKFSIRTVHGGLMANPVTHDRFTSEPSKPVALDEWINIQIEAGKLAVVEQ